MLAACLGRRLYGHDSDQLPKALLRFNEMTLLERHISILTSCGIEELIIVVGYKSHEIISEVNRVAPPGFTSFIFNERFKEGPKISLACADEVLRSGSDLLFMDSDVLYHSELLKRLCKSPNPNCIAMDREFQSTDDFVKVCLKDERVIDFGKSISKKYDVTGEWPGLLKMSAEWAELVARVAQSSLKSGKEVGDYEEIFQEAMFDLSPMDCKIEDVSGIPWIEIDYMSDLAKANNRILPLLDWEID